MYLIMDILHMWIFSLLNYKWYYGKYWLNVGSISYNEKIHEKKYIFNLKKKIPFMYFKGW